MGKVRRKDNLLQFNLDKRLLFRLFQKKMENDQPLDGLGFLFSAYKKEPNSLDVISKIANTYTVLGLYENSNKFWFTYLSLATEEKFALAYENLAKNFYLLDNYWLTNYYLNKVVLSHGHVTKEEFGEYIDELWADSLDDNRVGYHIAYPFDKADYSHKENVAKRAFDGGDFFGATALYSAIPYECMSKESLDNLAVSYFMLKEDAKAIKVNKFTLSKFGDDVYAYCNLSTLYNAKRDEEKSGYYYAKALSSRKGELGESYKIATCAIEQNDFSVAEKCIEKVLDDRPYDSIMWFYFGVSKVNQGNFSGGEQAFSTAYRLCPYDSVFEFFANYFGVASESGKDRLNICPVSFDKVLPSQVRRTYKRKITSFVGVSAENVVKNKQNLKILLWGVKEADEETAKKCAVTLAFNSNRQCEDLLLDLLLDTDVTEEKKKLIIFALILCGRKKKFGVNANNVFVSVKPRKLIFDGKDDGMLFASAYAYALSKVVFWGEFDLDKVGFNINKIYTKYGEEIIKKGLSVEEIATLNVFTCNYKKDFELKKLCRAFGVKKDRIQEFTPKKGEIDD